MKYFLLGFIMFAAGCMTMPTTINITCPEGTIGSVPTVTVSNAQNKSVNTSPSLTTRDVSVPVK